MLYFDLIPIELLHQILYNILDFNDILTLYKLDSPIIRKIFDDHTYWEGKIRHYIIPFTIDFNKYKKLKVYNELDFLQRMIMLKNKADYTDKFDININYKNIPQKLLDYKDGGIFDSLQKFAKLFTAYIYAVSIIEIAINKYFAHPDINYLMEIEFSINDINNFELLCLPYPQDKKVKFFNSLREMYPSQYRMMIYIGRYFYFQLYTSDYEDDRYEVKLQNVFDLLLHLQCKCFS